MLLLTEAIKSEKNKIIYLLKHLLTIIVFFVTIYLISHLLYYTEHSKIVETSVYIFPILKYFQTDNGYSPLIFSYLLYWPIGAWHIYVVSRMYLYADSAELSKAASHQNFKRTFSIFFLSIASLFYIIGQLLPDIQPPDDRPKTIVQALAGAFIFGTGTTIDLFLTCQERLHKWRGAR